MRRIFALTLLGFALTAASARGQGQDMSQVQIRTVPVAPGISMLVGRGGNIGVSTGPDGVFLIDDQYAPLSEKIKAAVAALDARPIRFVLNTHWHGDHTGGNENLGKAGVILVAHDNVRQRMSTEQFLTAFNEKVPPSPGVALPVVTFSDTVTFHLNGDEIHAHHVAPAHTDGDSLVWFKKANVVHMGDLYFNGMYPFIDVDAGGSAQGMLAATEWALANVVKADTKVIPGHGPLSDRAGLEAFRDMLRKVVDRIGPMVAAGKSLDEVKAAKPLADLDEAWGKGFLNAEAFVGIVYAGFQGKK